MGVVDPANAGGSASTGSGDASPFLMAAAEARTREKRQWRCGERERRDGRRGVLRAKGDGKGVWSACQCQVLKFFEMRRMSLQFPAGYGHGAAHHLAWLGVC